MHIMKKKIYIYICTDSKKLTPRKLNQSTKNIQKHWWVDKETVQFQTVDTKTQDLTRQSRQIQHTIGWHHALELRSAHKSFLCAAYVQIATTKFGEEAPPFQRFTWSWSETVLNSAAWCILHQSSRLTEACCRRCLTFGCLA